MGKASHRVAMAGIILLGVVLRGLRSVARWHEDAWLYAAYPAETIDLLESGDWAGAATTFMGLHPPGWPLLHATLELWMPVPALFIATSVAASLGAVWLVARHDRLAACVLATGPVAVHYAAEVNQYPLLCLTLGGLWTAACRPDGSPRLRLDVAAWGLLAAWTHALGGLSAVVATALLPRPARRKTLLVMGIGVLPLAPGVLDRLAEPTTFAQPDWHLELVAADLVGRFGVFGLLVLAAWGKGARTRPWLLGSIVAIAASIAVLTTAGAAAPHQFPYLLVLGAPAALLAAHGARSHRLGIPLLLGLAAVQGGWQLVYDTVRVGTIVEDVRAGERGIDEALHTLSTPWTCRDELSPDCSGDALVLLRPPGRNDDDKTRTSPVLWRLSPFQRMPRVALPTAEGPVLDWGDHRHGQPRLVHVSADGRGPFAVYVHDHARSTLADLPQRHRAGVVVASDVGQRREYTVEIDALIGVMGTQHRGDRLSRWPQPAPARSPAPAPPPLGG